MLGWMKAPKQRVEELDKENKKLHRDIAQVFGTRGRAYIYSANGHGACC